MLEILNKELRDYPEHLLLKKNINGIFRELSISNYDRVIGLSDQCIEICSRQKEQAVSLGNEEIANSMFVIIAYCKMLKLYSKYWKAILLGKYSESWSILQDTIDKLIDVTKFNNEQNKFGINKFNDHLYELEKLYPYKLFASIEMVIKTKKCNICGKLSLDLECTHIPGYLYWGNKAITICGDIELQAVAIVEHPLDKRCIMEISDDKRTDKEKFKILEYFVENNKNPLKLFSSIESDKFYYNELYNITKRNDLCPCNSGKKFKRCCGENKYEKGSHFHLKLKEDIVLQHLLITDTIIN